MEPTEKLQGDHAVEELRRRTVAAAPDGMAGADRIARPDFPEHFRAKRTPVRGKKIRQSKVPEPFHDSENRGTALDRRDP